MKKIVSTLIFMTVNQSDPKSLAEKIVLLIRAIKPEALE